MIFVRFSFKMLGMVDLFLAFCRAKVRIIAESTKFSVENLRFGKDFLDFLVGFC